VFPVERIEAAVAADDTDAPGGGTVYDVSVEEAATATDLLVGEVPIISLPGTDGTRKRKKTYDNTETSGRHEASRSFTTLPFLR
jgi:hypothetical protein